MTLFTRSLWLLALLVGALAYKTDFSLGAATPKQTPATQVTPPQGAAPGAPPAAGQAGVARGRGNAAAMLFAEQCVGCHGADLAGGTASSLFDDKWTIANDNEAILKAITDGVPGAASHAFRDRLTEPQLWSLVVSIRAQAATLKGRPAYVAEAHGEVVKSEKQTFRIETLTKDLETPWALAFLPDGSMLVTERPGRLRIIDKSGKLLPAPVKGTPAVWEKQDGGLLDVEVHPNYARNGWIYLSYSEVLPGYVAPPAPAPAVAPAPAAPGAGVPGQPAAAGRGGATDPPTMTVIVRGKISKANEWTDQQVIFRAPADQYTVGNAHYGSRFTFDRQGRLFFALGEKQVIQSAQDLSKTTGKIHRVNDDGTAPKDNPFVSTPNAVPTIWSLGHRNPQGFAWDPVSGRLWESEHGPGAGDEINVIQAGRNYGWGVITMGTQAGITKRFEPGMEQPVAYYLPSVAPSGMAFYTGSRYPGWKNSLFVGCLGGQQLKRLEVKGDTITHQEVVFNQFGRVRDIVQGPDGFFYLALQTPGTGLADSTPGSVVRLVPVAR